MADELSGQGSDLIASDLAVPCESTSWLGLCPGLDAFHLGKAHRDELCPRCKRDADKVIEPDDRTENQKAINLEWIQPTASQKADPIARWIEPDSSKPPAPGIYLTEEEYPAPAGVDRSAMLITRDGSGTRVTEFDVEGSWSWGQFSRADTIDRYWSAPIKWPS